MLTRTAAALAATIMMTGAALAAEGALKVEKSAALEVAPADVWAAIGKFDDMSWHPAVKSTDMVKDAPAGSATRILHLKAESGDPTITETLTATDEAARCYSYVIAAVDPAVVPVTNYASTLCVKDDGGKATVAWSGTFDPVSADAAGSKAATDAITGIYDAGLGALTEKFGARN